MPWVQKNCDNISNETGRYQLVEWSALEIEPVPQAVYCALCTYMTIIMILAITFNGIVIGTTYKNKKLRQPLNYMLLNMAVADFLSAIIGGPVSVFSNAAGYFVFGNTACVVEGFVLAVVGIANLTSIVFLSVSRCLVIAKPFGVYVPKDMHAAIAVAITWVWGVIWNIPPLFWNGIDLEGIGTSCGPTWLATGPIAATYLMLYVGFCFFLPLGVLVVSYALILSSVRKAGEASSLDKSKSAKAEKSATKMVVLIMIAFLLCWTPYAAVTIQIVFTPNTKLDQYVGTFPAFLAKSATIYNPCIYILLNRQFRKAVFSFVGVTTKSLVSTAGESSIGMTRKSEAAPTTVA